MTACYCDGDPPSVISIVSRKARKPHRCCECGRTIHAGEKYEHVWGIWDSRPDTFNTCHLCTDLRELVAHSVPCFCWNYGNMREDAIETLREYAGEAPGLFFGGARLYVKANQMRAETWAI